MALSVTRKVLRTVWGENAAGPIRPQPVLSPVLGPARRPTRPPGPPRPRVDPCREATITTSSGSPFRCLPGEGSKVLRTYPSARSTAFSASPVPSERGQERRVLLCAATTAAATTSARSVSGRAPVERPSGRLPRVPRCQRRWSPRSRAPGRAGKRLPPRRPASAVSRWSPRRARGAPVPRSWSGNRHRARRDGTRCTYGRERSAPGLARAPIGPRAGPAASGSGRAREERSAGSRRGAVTVRVGSAPTPTVSGRCSSPRRCLPPRGAR